MSLNRKAVEMIKRYIAPLTQRVLHIVVRGIASTIDDEKKMQLIQLAAMADETLDDIERFQNYGFTSHPKPGAEAIGLSIGGDRGHTVVIAVDDRRFRLTALEEGEVAIYDDQGQKVHLARDGIQIFSEGTVSVEGGMIELGEGAAESVVLGDSFAAIYNAHTHTGNLGAPTGPPNGTMDTALSQKVITE